MSFSAARESIAKVLGLTLFLGCIAFHSHAHAGQAKPVDYTPAIDVILQSGFATGSDAYSFNGSPFTNGSPRLGGKFDEYIARNVDVSYQHSYVEDTVGNAPTPGNHYVDDPVDDYRLNYMSNRPLNFGLGYYFRHRDCCPAAGAPGNIQPTTVRRAYLEINYTLPPFKNLNGATLQLNAREVQTLDHQTTPAGVLAANPQIKGDEGNRIRPMGGATLTLPLSHRAHLSAFVAYNYTYDYYDYRPIAAYEHIIDWGITKKLSPNLTFKATNSNLHQFLQGYPNPDRNAIHRTKMTFTLDAKIGRN